MVVPNVGQIWPELLTMKSFHEQWLSQSSHEVFGAEKDSTVARGEIVFLDLQQEWFLLYEQ